MAFYFCWQHIVGSSTTARDAGAAGRAAAAIFIFVPFIFDTSPLLLSVALLPRPSTIVVIVLIIVVGLIGCDILGGVGYAFAGICCIIIISCCCCCCAIAVTCRASICFNPLIVDVVLLWPALKLAMD